MKRGEPTQESGAKLAEAARDTRRKITFLLKKPHVEQHEIYILAKAFFKVYLKKEYEFTADELQKEIHKVYLSSAVRERVEHLIEKLSLLEYTDTRYGQTEVKLLLHDLEEIVHLLVIEHKRQIPFLTRVANWLFCKKVPQAETVISEYPAIEQNDPITVELSVLLEDIYLALDQGNVGRAEKLYKKLFEKYHLLGATKRQEFYHNVQAAYEAIIAHSK